MKDTKEYIPEYWSHQKKRVLLTCLLMVISWLLAVVFITWLILMPYWDCYPLGNPTFYEACTKCWNDLKPELIGFWITSTILCLFGVLANVADYITEVENAKNSNKMGW
ncbi:MAG: hypothetical protein M0P71_01805 [Melioribacteraceae bacterium]|nr:hypothetical protein [Melioribacteraceae bacterium]